eukprot:6877944-Ditylum_brightwellii.AAC.1
MYENVRLVVSQAEEDFLSFPEDPDDTTCNAIHLKYMGSETIVSEEVPLWAGQTKKQQLCMGGQIGEWVQVKPGAAKITTAMEQNVILSKNILPSNTKLGTRWTPPLQDGNPVVLYQQDSTATCLFNDVSSVLAYYGDHVGAELVNSKSHLRNSYRKSSTQFINELLMTVHGNGKGKRSQQVGYDILKCPLQCKTTTT